MAVPCGDQRDFDFAKHFDLPIKNIFKDVDITRTRIPKLTRQQGACYSQPQVFNNNSF